MKTRIVFLILFLSIQEISFCICGNFEICIENRTDHIIKVKLYPISSIFNGFWKYSLLAKRQSHVCNQLKKRFEYNSTVYLPFVNNCNKKIDTELNLLEELTLETDVFKETNPNSVAQGSFGMGRYKLFIEHYTLDGNEIEAYDSCIIEIDWHDSESQIDTLRAPGDLKICVYNQDKIGQPGITYWFDHYTIYWDSVHISNYNSENYKIKFWQPEGPGTHWINKRNGSPSDGYFQYDGGSYSYNNLPIDCRLDCNQWGYPNQNHEFDENDTRQGDLFLNLRVMKDISSPLIGYKPYDYVLPLNIIESVKLKISNDITYNLVTPQVDGNFKFILNCQEGGTLILDNNSKIILNNRTWVQLNNESSLLCGNNTRFQIWPGGVLCNLGANIDGRMFIQYMTGIHFYCDLVHPDYIISDSTLIEITDGAILYVPDNSTLYFKDPETVLKLDSNSTLKFGQNSKVVFMDGARICAYKAKFSSINSNALWDGIYLSGFSNDTIKNCIIENASSGISIKNKNTLTGSESSVEISNCTFKNTTNTVIANCLYAVNSNNILIRDNAFESSFLTNGYLNAILLEYCPAENFNIIGNNITASASGISIIQSSPYIARNIVTGSNGSDYGIFLDNSGGVIKYNIINNFRESVEMHYSSPFLFRNNLNNASESNLDLNSNSAPLLRPVISGSELYWLGGNNTVTGYPSSAGIGFNDESYPVLDSGYNIEILNGSDYMKGVIPSFLNRTLYATLNNWQDIIPIPSRFNVQEGDVVYEPLYDGTSPITIDDYELYDVGFGIFDTVYIKNIGDSPGDILYLTAYKQELNGNYENAINTYKQIIASYKKSFYAISSVARILICMEKAGNNNVQYQLTQNYLNQIKINNLFPKVLRELAEDYVIKCKVKRKMYDEAINDYNQMYELNKNKPKGFHALLNKKIIMSIKNDTTDNPMVGFLSADLWQNKIISEIKSKNNLRNENKNSLIPEKFALYQNYPNPFNPLTNINIDIPEESFIALKIFDITGREIETLINDKLYAGTYKLLFNGSKYSSGIYFYTLYSNDRALHTKKMVIIK